MLDRLTNFVGSTVLSVILVFGLLFLAFGNWKLDNSPRTASNIERPAPAVPTPQ
jgi:hypothetical protein